MALQLGQYQLPGAISAELVKPFLDYKTDGALAMANALGNAGNNLGNAVGGMMARNREEQKAQSLAGLGGMLSNGDFAGAANAAAQAGNPELAMKLGLAGYEHKQQSDSLAALGGMLGDSGGGGGGLGFGGAAGSTPTDAKSATSGGTTDAASVIAKFEGFRDKPYWDVNHHRVGYGSDTITTADGRVIEVQPGMSVSREDANRDLSRRVGEFQSGIQKDIGADSWGRLPEGAKAALTSVAYNYGAGWASKIPSLAEAARSGDVNAIAKAIASRAGDNGGVNAKRRNMEAALALNGIHAEHGPESPGAAPTMAGAGAAPMGAQANSGEVNGLMKQWDQINRAMMSPAFANAGEAGQNALKQRAEMIKTRLGMLGKTEGLPADYREYQLASSDPNFAKYMQDKRGASAQGEGAKITEVANARRQLIIDQGGNPDDPQSKQFILSGKFPREDQSPLTATDKKAILEADELVSANKSALEALNYAKTLSKKAMGFPGAGVISKAGSMVGNEASIATQELDNTVMGNALAQLKATFGGAPSDAEHKLLVELQGSSSQPDAVRQKIFDRAIQMATHKLEFNQGRADELRGGTYYGPNNGKPQQAAPQAHPMEGRTATNPQTGERMIFRNGNWAKY